MTWTFDTTEQTWTKSGSGREALMSAEDLGASASVTLELVDSSEPVLVVLMSSPDGKTCYEVGVVSTDLVIQTRKWGNTASSKASTSVASIASGAYSLGVQRRGNIIEATITDSDGVDFTATYTNAEDVFEWSDSWGFVSSTDGAIVARATKCGLKPTRSSRKDVLIVIGSGSVFVYDQSEGSIRTLAGSVFSADGDVWAFAYRQKVYAGDGRVAKVIDPADDTDPVIPWTPTAGYLPGQSSAADRTAGLCSATCATVYFDRPALAGDPADPQNIHLSRVGDPLDWDYAADGLDRAYGGSTDRSRVGQPVIALEQSASGLMVVGCRDSIWQLSGDPTIGIPEIIEIDPDSGVSDANGLHKIRDGLVLAHSPAGLMLVTPGASVPLSEPVLTEGIQLDRATIQNTIVSVVRDPDRYLTWVFLTSRATGASVHFAYSERVGQFTPGSGGFLPQQFPNNAGPTAAALFQGKVLLGGRDGYIRVFDDDATDDDGVAIEVKIPILFNDGGLLHDVILQRWHLSLSKDSDTARVRVYGGIDAERVFDTSERWSLLNTTIASGRMRSVDRPVRAPAILMEISGSVASTQIDIEALEADVRLGRLTTKKARSPFVAETLCPPPTSGGGSGSGGSSFGSGPGYGGSDTPSDSCGTVELAVGSDTYTFAEDSVVTGVFYGRCRDTDTSTGDGTLNNGWSGGASYSFAFENPTDTGSAIRWTFVDAGETSWVQFNDDGTWTYQMHSTHQAYYDCGTCSTVDGDQCDSVVQSTYGGAADDLIVDNSDPSHPTCADFSSSVCDIGLFADFDLDNGCAEDPAAEATGFRHYLEYTVA